MLRHMEFTRSSESFPSRKMLGHCAFLDPA
jgi:hypothetical protein